ncbi:MAG: hypothetical protein AABY22_00305 [Nanoarchaeota archaeon]
MVKIICDCGFKAEGENNYKAEAVMWHHAINDHLEMLKNLGKEDIENILKSNDNQMNNH